VKIYNTYILIIATLLLLTTVVLAALGQDSLDIYYTAYIIEALVVTELFVYFNAKAWRGLSLISAILCGGFLIIMSLQAIKILT